MMRYLTILVMILLLVACSSDDPPPVFQATAAAEVQNAPVYTDTPQATVTPTIPPTATHTLTPPATATPTLTLTPQATATATLMPTLESTLPLMSPTAPVSAGMPPAFENQPASFSPTEGWSCGDFPCEDDIEGFTRRIRVPDGYVLEHIGRFPGQPMQITYGMDGRLYATVLEDGTRNGAVYVMDTDGQSMRYSGDLVSPLGLAFQPGTMTLYVSARITPTQGGGIWEIQPDGTMQQVINGLPCCYATIDNQPNGMIFGPDGWLYIGVGSLTDRLEPVDPRFENFATLNDLEASILRLNPHTGDTGVYARGIRNPYDLTYTADGQIYATDNGLVTGPGDRLLRVEQGGHYGWPYWRNRGCAECPLTDFSIDIRPDFVRFSNYTLPRGITAYHGTQFPENLWDDLFVALWHGTPESQRVVRIDPDTVPGDPTAPYEPEPFVTGLIRPIDVTVAPDGSLVVADFVYGHIWRVRYAGS